MSRHLFQEGHIDGGVGGENGQCKEMVRDERVHVCVNGREKEVETAKSCWSDI